MAESSVRVHISTTADTAAIAQARQALDQVRAAQGAQAAGAQAGAGAAQSLAGGMGRVSSQASDAAGSLREADRAGQGFLDTLRLGVGIDLGGRLIQGLSEIAATLQQATRDGLEFNAMLESSQITIASVLRANGARTFESAYARSGEILDGH